jgi:hypothetical protein
MMGLLRPDAVQFLSHIASARVLTVRTGVSAVLSVVQKQSSRQVPIRVTVYDAVGIGAGGSGAAAGLLHPFAPTGKVCPPMAVDYKSGTDGRHCNC